MASNRLRMRHFNRSLYDILCGLKFELKYSFCLQWIARQIKKLLQGVSATHTHKVASKIIRLIVETGTITGKEYLRPSQHVCLYSLEAYLYSHCIYCFPGDLVYFRSNTPFLLRCPALLHRKALLKHNAGGHQQPNEIQSHFRVYDVERRRKSFVEPWISPGRYWNSCA